MLRRTEPTEVPPHVVPSGEPASSGATRLTTAGMYRLLEETVHRRYAMDLHKSHESGDFLITPKPKIMFLMK
jgi:hypothetical protein